MSRVIEPDLETLVAYVHGTLRPRDADAVARWLHSGAGEDELALYRSLVLERERALALLGATVAHPIRARVLRLARRLARSLEGTVATIDEASRGAAFVPLSGAARDDLVIEIPPGIVVDLELRLRKPGHYAAFALEADGRLHERGHGRADASKRVELGAIELEQGDAEVDLFVFIDSAGALPAPPAGADGSWLLDQLEALSVTRCVVHRTLRCARQPSPDGP